MEPPRAGAVKIVGRQVLAKLLTLLTMQRGTEPAEVLPAAEAKAKHPKEVAKYEKRKVSVAPAVVSDAGMNDDNDNDDGMSPFLLGPVLTFLLPTESGPEGVGSEDAARQTGKHERQESVMSPFLSCFPRVPNVPPRRLSMRLSPSRTQAIGNCPRSAAQA